MRNLRKIFLPAACAAALLTAESCQKNSDQQTTPPTNTELLTTSAWRVDIAGIDQDRNGTVDISLMALLPTCLTDNSITFRGGNAGTTDEGASKCNSTDPQTSNFTWSFADNETSLNVSNSVLTQINGKSKILELSAAALRLTKDTVIGGATTALVVNLKH